MIAERDVVFRRFYGGQSSCIKILSLAITCTFFLAIGVCSDIPSVRHLPIRLLIHVFPNFCDDVVHLLTSSTHFCR